VLLLAALLRGIQPPQFESARTSWAIVEWATAHISRPAAATIFIALPGMVLVAGMTMLWQRWNRDPSFRQDCSIALVMLRRHAAIILVATATLVGGLIFAGVLLHIVTD
jgi:hypothetical protein